MAVMVGAFQMIFVNISLTVCYFPTHLYMVLVCNFFHHFKRTVCILTVLPVK